MINLYVTRHGQTVWNVERKFQGRKDSPLTELGKMQALLFHERLKKLDVDIIYCSPSQRTIETMRLMKGELEIPVVFSEKLYEMGFGDWEGKNIIEIGEKYPVECNNLYHHPDTYLPITGETYESVFDRTKSLIDEILEKEQDKNVLVITHGITRKAIMTFFQEKSLEEFWNMEAIAKQASLTHIKIQEDGIYEVLLKNDYMHWKHLEE